MTSKFEYTSAGIRRPDQARGDLYDRIQFHTGLFFLFFVMYIMTMRICCYLMVNIDPGVGNLGLQPLWVSDPQLFHHTWTH